MKKLIYALTLSSVSILVGCKETQKVSNIASTDGAKVTNQIKKNEATIDLPTVKKHLYTLASDEMQGRKPGTEGMEKATQYIENEYKRIGLKTFKELTTYRQNFEYKGIKMSNVIGLLEGNSKKDEFVIVSAHHDHLGTKKEGEGDLIFNGANDDASGVTGVLALAEYFAKKGTNERSILFVCFTAEEMGLVGSEYFGKGIDASKFVAGINLELIGKEPKTGPKTAWLTGFDKSDFGRIIQKNLEGSGYQLFPDPYPKFQLFLRSDNASLARLGVPSHTFSTTPIDIDTDYHKVTDEAETLDMEVLTETVKAVARGTESIINGKDTPSRVEMN
ncbi:M28 family peptidase [Tenacibaculum caenipelagi]|uniref:Peptidase M28-like protein n=1 Tax=Tenacibaculum caenipelagi TaxID=1325435 RepID=A0A4R6TP57_9FLAO|nr:M28 family peptidase [Tenacibaculum caenipelagi]TDQ30069.1 peptidase M28-like protein [Tenacibaculum caenipelagi]